LLLLGAYVWLGGWKGHDGAGAGNKLLAQVGEDSCNFIQTFRGGLARMST